MRGRKPTPTAKKRLHGNPGKRKPKAKPVEPKPLDGAAPPEFLSETAKLEWTRLTTEMRAIGILTALDLGVLTVYCIAWGDLVEAETELRTAKKIIKGRDKNLVRTPWLMVRKQAMDAIAKHGSELGLSPASRPRLGRTGIPLPAGNAHDQGQQPTDSLGAHLAARPATSSVH